MERSRDWWTHAQADPGHAQAAAGLGHFEGARFAAHQAAEKGLKAVFERRGENVAGRSVRYLLSALGEGIPPGPLSAAKVLDRRYLPTRYPTGLAQGAPTEFYTPGGKRCDRREEELASRPEVEAVVLFGSSATGRAVPGSDLLIVLREDVRPFLDRLPDYVPADVPLPRDVFPDPRAAVEAGQPRAGEALRTGWVLWPRSLSGFDGLTCPPDGGREGGGR